MVIQSSYRPVTLLKNGHINTIYRTFFQKIDVDFKRHRLNLDDGDFLDLDRSTVNSNTVVVAIHGLEGSTKSTYIKALTHYLNLNRIDVLGLNLRGCSEENNKLYQSYHSGKTDDLDHVINYIEKTYSYTNIVLIGYSLGGNLILKYLGDGQYKISSLVKASITISVPCNLHESAIHMTKWFNKIYLERFLRTLKTKALKKLELYPNCGMSHQAITEIKNFKDFDDLYTAPAHGFKDAIDYWQKCSAKPFITSINTPSLLVTSMDDPFLPPSCFPHLEAKQNRNFFLELSTFGGHVGFNKSLENPTNFWLENRILKFINEIISTT